MNKPIRPRKRRANSNQTDWRLGRVRKLRRLIRLGLSYTDIGRVLQISRNAVAGAVSRYEINMTPEELQARQSTAGLERASWGGRSRPADDWEARLFETYAARKKRLARRAAA